MASHLSTCRTIYLSVSLFILISIYLWAHFQLSFFTYLSVCLSFFRSHPSLSVSHFFLWTRSFFQLSWLHWKRICHPRFYFMDIMEENSKSCHLHHTRGEETHSFQDFENFAQHISRPSNQIFPYIPTKETNNVITKDRRIHLIFVVKVVHRLSSLTFITPIPCMTIWIYLQPM